MVFMMTTTILISKQNKKYIFILWTQVPLGLSFPLVLVHLGCLQYLTLVFHPS